MKKYCFFIIMILPYLAHGALSLKEVVSYLYYYDSTKRSVRPGNPYKKFIQALFTASDHKAQGFTTAPLDLWRRVTIALVIYDWTTDFFEYWIKPPLLSDWVSLNYGVIDKKITFEENRRWFGLTVFYKNFRAQNLGIELSDEAIVAMKAAFGDQKNPNKYYRILINELMINNIQEKRYSLCLQTGDQEVVHLLNAPENGTLFCRGPFYGLIDFKQKKATLHYYSNHQLANYQKKEATLYCYGHDYRKEIDLTPVIPWSDLTIDAIRYAKVGFDHEELSFVWWGNSLRAKGSRIYQIKEATDPVYLQT